MLTPVAQGVLIHRSTFCRSNAVVVAGQDGVLLVDPGIRAEELDCLADDLADVGPMAAGFATHPHWDHLLWHPGFGAPPRYATARAAETITARMADPAFSDRLAGMLPPDIADQIPFDLFGLVTGLPSGTTRLPWEGPAIRIFEHRAHAPGHAALLIEDGGILVAGDMLSDVLVPLLDLSSPTAVEDYLAALDLLDSVASQVEVVIPGHGSVGDARELRTRIDRDRAYVQALRNRETPDDPRIGPAAEPGWEWVADVHARQAQHLS